MRTIAIAMERARTEDDSWPLLDRRLQHLSTKEREDIRTAFHSVHTIAGMPGKASRGSSRRAIAVATMLASMGATRDILIAALLASVQRPERVSVVFGAHAGQCTQYLAAVLHSDTLERAEKLRDILALMQNNVGIVVAILVDRLLSMSEIEKMPEDRRWPYAQETLDLYVRIADRLCMLELREELEGLCLRFLQPPLFAQLHDHCEESLVHARQEVLPDINAMLQTSLLTPYCTVSCALPSWSDLRQERNARDVERPPDTVIICICSDTEKCYEMLSALHRTWRHETFSFRDHINSPAMNGYRGLHTTLIRHDGSRICCHIRSQHMDVYARNGIASVCFEEHFLGLADYLPWVERLAKTPDKTSVRAKGESQSIEEEILWSHIAIHDSTDRIIHIPASATALDGAFFCYGEQALWADTILIDNQPSPFSSPLKDGCTVKMLAGKERTVERAWLSEVRTWQATSAIRNALFSQSRGKKLATGKALLQRVMHEHRRGFLEEFKEKSLTRPLKTLGAASLDDALVAIAEGTLDAQHACNTLFPTRKIWRNGGPVAWAIRGPFPSGNGNSLHSLARICRRYGADIRSIRWNARSAVEYGGSVYIKAALPEAQQRAFMADLQAAGMPGMEAYSFATLFLQAAATAVVIFLWAVDPVLAKMLLTTLPDVHPFDFAFLRSVGFFAACLALFLAWRHLSPYAYRRLPWSDTRLWIGGAALGITSIGTYFSLQHLLPQEYITITMSTAIFVPLLHAWYRGVLRRWPLILGGSVLACTFLALMRFHPPALSPSSVFVPALSIFIGFSVFTVCIDVFKREHHIAVRMPVALAMLSCIALGLHVFFLPFVGLHVRDAGIVALLLVYGAVEVGIPYILFYSVITTSGARWVAQYFFIAVCITLGLQFIVFKVLDVPLLLPLALVSIVAYLFHQRRYLYPLTLLSEDRET